MRNGVEPLANERNLRFFSSAAQILADSLAVEVFAPVREDYLPSPRPKTPPD